MNFSILKDLFLKNKIAIIAIAISICSVGGSILYVIYEKGNCPVCEDCDMVEKVAQTESSIESTTSEVEVDVKGAVKKPGVYTLTEGSNIKDAITLAGGITSKGSTKNINLSKKLKDEMVIYVFTKEELKQKETANEVVCEIPECKCETVTITECPKVNSSETGNNKTDGDVKKDKISINTGTLEELTTLNGIGASKAQAIIDYRNQNGPFKTIEDLKNVSGIGDLAFEKIKDNITI